MSLSKGFNSSVSVWKIIVPHIYAMRGILPWHSIHCVDLKKALHSLELSRNVEAVLNYTLRRITLSFLPFFSLFAIEYF